MIPVLLTTYNRLEFTKKALFALANSDCGDILIVDNGSTDGTVEYLRSIYRECNFRVVWNSKNEGIAGAMNDFLEWSRFDSSEFRAKVDNDTIVPPKFFSILEQKILRCNLDMVQARHPILKDTYPAGFDAWMKTMKQDPNDPTVFYNHFIGGSGIVFRRSAVDKIPETKSLLNGWRQFQSEHPHLRKAFTTAVSVELLDMKPEGGSDYSAYPEYYKTTGRYVNE